MCDNRLRAELLKELIAEFRANRAERRTRVPWWRKFPLFPGEKIPNSVPMTRVVEKTCKNTP